MESIRFAGRVVHLPRTRELLSSPTEDRVADAWRAAAEMLREGARADPAFSGAFHCQTSYATRLPGFGL